MLLKQKQPVSLNLENSKLFKFTPPIPNNVNTNSEDWRESKLNENTSHKNTTGQTQDLTLSQNIKTQATSSSTPAPASSPSPSFNRLQKQAQRMQNLEKDNINNNW